MAVSIAQSQKAFIKSKFITLNQIGQAKGVGGVPLDEVEQILVDLAIRFKVEAERNLNETDSMSSARLANSIQFESVQYMGGVYSIEIKVLDYYKFIDKGVRGVKNEKGGSSPYKFKNLFVSDGMRKEIRKWLIREGMKVTTKPVTKKHALGTEKKGTAFKGIDKTDAFATAIARSIKKKGIRPTNFWTDAEKKVHEYLQRNGGQGFEVAIINELTR